MTLSYGLGMLFMGMTAILIATIIAYFVINKYLKDKAFEEGLAKCKNQDEIYKFLSNNLPRD